MGRRRRARLFGRTGRRPDRPGFYVDFYDYPGNGKRIHRTKNFLSVGPAREWVRRFNAKADLREIGRVVPIAIGDASREYLTTCWELAQSTKDDYSSCIAGLAILVGLETEISKIKPAQVERFLRQRGGTKATTARIAANLYAFFKWCVGQNYCTANPVAWRKRGHTRERPVVNDEDVWRIYEFLDTDDRRLAMLIAMTTGMDRGMIETLTASQIDFDCRCITFKRRKTGKDNTVPIHVGVLPLLRDRVDRIGRGQPLLSGLSRQKRVRDWWKVATKKAGLPDLLFRDLRSYATKRLVRAGASSKDVQTLLGHASVLTTLNHYVPPDPDTMRRLDALPLPSGPASAVSTAAI